LEGLAFKLADALVIRTVVHIIAAGPIFIEVLLSKG